MCAYCSALPQEHFFLSSNLFRPHYSEKIIYFIHMCRHILLRLLPPFAHTLFKNLKLNGKVAKAIQKIKIFPISYTRFSNCKIFSFALILIFFSFSIKFSPIVRLCHLFSIVQCLSLCLCDSASVALSSLSLSQSLWSL